MITDTSVCQKKRYICFFDSVFIFVFIVLLILSGGHILSYQLPDPTIIHHSRPPVYFLLRLSPVLPFFHIFHTKSDRMLPAIQPIPLWIISSHSNKPRHKTSCNISIEAETAKPTKSPSHQRTFRFLINGSKIPSGNKIIILSRFSCTKKLCGRLPSLPFFPICQISFHDQKSSN